MRTRITDLFALDYPIIQGGMAWVSDARLAAAVSNAGGLGTLACGGASPERVRAQIELVRSLTDRAFCVNIMMMSPHTEELAELVAEMRVPAVATGAGSPSPYMAMWKEAGIKVMPVIASVAHAKRMQKLGADAVIAEGCESGGHIGEITTMVLVPAVCDAVDIPVVAAGGIADGRGVAAAFALGAEGVQMGTRFLTAHECGIHRAYKAKVLSARDSDTIVTGRGAGHPARQLKNRFSRDAAAAERSQAQEDPEFHLAGSLKRAVEGDVETGSLMAGQCACLVSDEKPAAAIMGDIMDEALSWGAATLEGMAERNALRRWGERS